MSPQKMGIPIGSVVVVPYENDSALRKKGTVRISESPTSDKELGHDLRASRSVINLPPGNSVVADEDGGRTYFPLILHCAICCCTN